jgi:uncharacterized membrane protein
MKKYLVAGLLTWLPLAITIWVLKWLLEITDSVFSGVLKAAKAVLPTAAGSAIDQLAAIPFLSVLVLALLMIVTGVFVTNVFGQWWVTRWDRLMGRIPLVKSIYSSVKQVSDTLFSSSGNAFREAVLVQYPRHGSWTVAFVTGKPGGEVASHLDGEWLSVYVPTTPNPTSGFFLVVKRSDVVELAMSVDQALKYVISMGVVVPPPPPPLGAGDGAVPSSAVSAVASSTEPSDPARNRTG